MSVNPEHVKALTNIGMSEELAKKTAEIIGKDDHTLPDLGRSESEQQIVQQAWQTVNSTRKS